MIPIDSNTVRQEIVRDLVHALAVGMAHTGQLVSGIARGAGCSRGHLHMIFDRGYMPQLGTIAKLAAAAGLATTIVIHAAGDEHPPVLRASSAHLGCIAAGKYGPQVLARMATRVPELTIFNGPSEPGRLETWTAPRRDVGERLAADTLQQYGVTLSHALAAQLVSRSCSIAGLAGLTGFSRSRLHAVLRRSGGVGLDDLHALLTPLGLCAHVVYDRIGTPRQRRRISVTDVQLATIRISHAGSLEVLERLNPALCRHCPWPSDDEIRRQYQVDRSRTTLAGRLRVPASWLDEQLRRLGLVVPASRTSLLTRQVRNALICSARRNGASYRKLSVLFGLSPQRINQIIQQQHA